MYTHTLGVKGVRKCVQLQSLYVMMMLSITTTPTHSQLLFVVVPSPFLPRSSQPRKDAVILVGSILSESSSSSPSSST